MNTANTSDEAIAPYRRLIAAWNARDAKAFAACFEHDGSAIGFDGSQMDGAKAIEGSLSRIFRDHPTAEYVTIVRGVRGLGIDVILLRAVAGMVPPGETKIKAKVNSIQSLVACRSEGAWKIALFQNTPAAFDERPEEAATLTEELQTAYDTQTKSA